MLHYDKVNVRTIDYKVLLEQFDRYYEEILSKDDVKTYIKSRLFNLFVSRCFFLKETVNVNGFPQMNMMDSLDEEPEATLDEYCEKVVSEHSVIEEKLEYDPDHPENRKEITERW